MKSITVRLVNPVLPNGTWLFGYGATAFPPGLTIPPDWTMSGQVSLGTALSITLPDADQYFAVRHWDGDMLVTQYRSPAAFAFGNNASYTFDATAATFTKDAPAGDWLDALVEFFAGLANRWAQWDADLAPRPWPYTILAPFVHLISVLMDGVFGALFDFEVFWRPFAAHVAELLDWDTLQDLLSEVLSHVADLWTWFSDWATSVGDVIATWWDGVTGTVQDWITIATEGLGGLLAAWDDFTTNTLPGLITLVDLTPWWLDRLMDVGDLISSAFTERADLWQGWTDFRQAVSDFFSDPEQWVYDRLDNFFERFW